MQKKTLGRFRKVLQIIKDEIIDDVDNDDNINNDDNEHSGSPILKRLMRPSPKYFLSIFSHIFPSLWFGFHWFSLHGLLWFRACADVVVELIKIEDN